MLNKLNAIGADVYRVQGNKIKAILTHNGQMLEVCFRVFTHTIEDVTISVHQFEHRAEDYHDYFIHVREMITPSSRQ